MVEVEEVALNITLPDDEIRLVLMQPYIKLDLQSEPFVWLQAAKGDQIARIRRTFEIAKQSVANGQAAQFTLLPEYSIPGLKGVEAVDAMVADGAWHPNSIVIGGVDGLTKDEYRQLCAQGATRVHGENSADNLNDSQWVNSAIAWIKESDGAVTRWVQPKISPSWPEEAITAGDMWQGRGVYLFSTKFANGTECRFMFLICFDWIGAEAGDILLWEILKKIDDDSNPNKKDLNLFFVLQHNPKPSHPSFLENTRRYFEEQAHYPFTPRTQGAVVFSNTAGGAKPGSYATHGFSSVIFSQVAPYDSQACPPSAAVVTKKLRDSASLGECKESLLRERGSCIHSIRLTLPQFINLGAADRSLPIKRADVHSVDPGVQDARVPGGPVPAIVKWVNDQLDILPSLLAAEENHPLKKAIEGSHVEISGLVKRESDRWLLNCMDLAAVSIAKEKWLTVGGRPVHLIDNWDGAESEDLKAVVYVLSIIRACRSLDIASEPAHAVIYTEKQVYDIIVVSGKTHQASLEHVIKRLGSSGQRIRIVITRDSANTMLPERDKPITSADGVDATKGPNITDPDTSWRHCGHQNVVSTCYGSAAIPQLEQRLRRLFKL